MTQRTHAATTIRAVRLRQGSAPTLEKVPRPGVGPYDVRLTVAFGGICHTDLHFIDGKRAARMLDDLTLGHEVAGTVTDVGPYVTRWASGDTVVVSPVGDRNGQSWVLGVHLDGGWADEIVVHEDMLVDVAGIALEEATIIPDAVSTPWAAITDSGRVRPGEAVGVWGVGGLGYHAVQLLRVAGAAPIIAVDTSEAARVRALAKGADEALDPSADDFATRILEITGGRGLNVAFDCFGHPDIQQQAFNALGRYGRLVLVGIPPVPLNIDSTPDLVRLSKQIIGHYGLEKRHITEVVALVRQGRLDLTESVSAVVPLAEFERGIDQLRTKVGNPIRILLQP